MMSEAPKKAVLLNVDDSDTSRMAITRMLRRVGFEVWEAVDGSSGLAMVQRQPDLVILDINLPDISGFEVCRRIKSDPATSRIPVLHLSAMYVQPQDRVHAMEGGADGYLTQPVDPQELVATITNLLRLRHMETELRNAAWEWRSSFDAIGDAMLLLDAGGRIIRCNRAFATIVGRPFAEIVGRRCVEVFGQGGDGEEICPYAQMRERGARVTTEVELSGRWFSVVVDPLLDEAGTLQGGVQVLTDITEHRRAEIALREREASFRLLFANNPHPMWVYDLATHGFLEVNDAAVTKYGYSREQFLGMRLEDIRPEEDLSRLAANLQAERVPLEFSSGWRHRLADGQVIDVEIASHSIEFAARKAVLVVAQDVTERRRLEDRLRQAQKVEAVGRLAGGVAHDINNLLQALLSAVQLMRLQHSDPAQVMRIIEELETDIQRGASLTRQLLLFSRQEVAKIELVDLNAVLREAIRMLRRLLRENIHFDVTLTTEPLWIESDRGQIEQVLVNLVVNASDAMPDGGLLTLATGRANGEGYLEVKDTGYGMDTLVMERIFDPFFTTKGAGKGTGLGLAVVHGIVTGHSGRIEVTSAPGAGSAFRVFLPLQTPPEALRERQQLGETAAPPVGHGERVLVVEDEDGAREGLRGLLEMLGYEVTALVTAEDALALPENAPFDLLLSDLLLPGASGSDLAIKLEDRWPDLQVILMSGYTEDEVVKLVVGAGMVRFLQKPFGIDTLAREVRAALADIRDE
jgi:two-component system, cell cycle sensor histidine kinase and response regulator CckA